MKVICIDNKHRGFGNGASELIEGNIYTVVESFIDILTNSLCYILSEIPPRDGYHGFAADRFIPLSSIDEMELLKERQANYDRVVCTQHLSK